MESKSTAREARMQWFQCEQCGGSYKGGIWESSAGAGMAHICPRCQREIDRDNQERNESGEQIDWQAVIVVIGLAITWLVSAAVWVSRKAAETIPEIVKHCKSLFNSATEQTVHKKQEILEFLPEEEEVYFQEYNEGEDN